MATDVKRMTGLNWSPPLMIVDPRSTKLWAASKSAVAVVVSFAAITSGCVKFTLMPDCAALGNITPGDDDLVRTVPSVSVTLDLSGSMTHEA